MASMTEKIDLRLLDRRTVERYIKRGLVDRKEYEKYLKALPDLADKAETVTVELEAVQIVPQR